MPAAPRPQGGLGWRSLGVFCQGLLLVSACSKGHHLARSRGSRYSRGHEMGLKGIPGRRPPGGGSGGGRKCVMAVSLSLLCVSDRGEPGADRISPGQKEALEDVGPLGLEPREAPWLLQGGGDTWASAHGPLPWPHLRCHMGTGIGPGAGRGGGGLPGSHLSDKALRTSLPHLPRCCTRPGRWNPGSEAWLAQGLGCDLFPLLFYGSDNGHLAGPL